MDATRLREVQAPLKDRYRTDPASARTPLGARGSYRDTDADDMALDRLARVTERYCVVGQSLREPPRFVVHRHGPGGAATADAPDGSAGR